MIIQCRQCRTKFFFEDSMMQGDGLWMRCSRCEHVFFQENPFTERQGDKTSLVSDEVFSEDVSPKKIKGDLSEENFPKPPDKDEDVVRFLDNVMEAKKNLDEQVNLEMEKAHDIRKERLAQATRSDVTGDLNKETAISPRNKQLSKKGTGKTWKVVIWSLLVIVVIPLIIYFVVFPQLGDRFVEIAHKYIGDPEPARPEVVIGQVKLDDIRQRMVTNNILGEIRVMEGTAVNQADYPICRIAIKGAIIDAYSLVLGERISHAGNVSTDDELVNMSEEEILRKLSQPEGNNNSNNKILPNGRIPFMIVFAKEPAGVIKTTVTTVGAERLLQ